MLRCWGVGDQQGPLQQEPALDRRRHLLTSSEWVTCGLSVHPACLALLVWILLVTQETRATVHKRHSVKCARTGQACRGWTRRPGRAGSRGHWSSHLYGLHRYGLE